jgi:hypothetical protein
MRFKSIRILQNFRYSRTFYCKLTSVTKVNATVDRCYMLGMQFWDLAKFFIQKPDYFDILQLFRCAFCHHIFFKTLYNSFDALNVYIGRNKVTLLFLRFCNTVFNSRKFKATSIQRIMFNTLLRHSWLIKISLYYTIRFSAIWNVYRRAVHPRSQC